MSSIDFFDLVSISDLVIWVAVLLISQAVILFFWVRHELKHHSPQYPSDPFASPHGDWPLMPMPSGSILDRPADWPLKLVTPSARRAAPAGQGSGGDGNSSRGAAAASPSSWRGRRAH